LRRPLGKVMFGKVMLTTALKAGYYISKTARRDLIRDIYGRGGLQHAEGPAGG
jgi:hypothetical protein